MRSPPVQTLNPNPQCDGTRGRRPWGDGIVRMEPSWVGFVPLWNRRWELSHCCGTWGPGEGHPCVNQEVGTARYGVFQRSLHNCEKWISTDFDCKNKTPKIPTQVKHLSQIYCKDYSFLTESNKIHQTYLSLCLLCKRGSFCRRKWQPSPVFLPGKSCLVGSSVHGVTKSRTRLSDLTFTVTRTPGRQDSCNQALNCHCSFYFLSVSSFSLSLRPSFLQGTCHLSFLLQMAVSVDSSSFSIRGGNRLS